jgi:hypothetical protein
MKETRVGYATIDALLEATKDYITAHTVNGQYTGKVEYLTKYQAMAEYMRRKP